MLRFVCRSPHTPMTGTGKRGHVSARGALITDDLLSSGVTRYSSANDYRQAQPCSRNLLNITTLARSRQRETRHAPLPETFGVSLPKAAMSLYTDHFPQK